MDVKILKAEGTSVCSVRSECPPIVNMWWGYEAHWSENSTVCVCVSPHKIQWLTITFGLQLHPRTKYRCFQWKSPDSPKRGGGKANIKIKGQNNGCFLYCSLWIHYTKISPLRILLSSYIHFMSAHLSKTGGGWRFAFRDVWPCSVTDSNRSLSGTCCLHLEQAAGSSKTSEVIHPVDYRVTSQKTAILFSTLRCHAPKDSDIIQHTMTSRPRRQ